MSYAPNHSETAQNVERLILSQDLGSNHSASNPALRSGKPRPALKARSRRIGTDYPLIVHSHLCWDWVWQRPQQFISQLSRRHRTLFVEVLAPEPSLAAPLARFRALPEIGMLTVLTLQFPAWRWGDAAYVDRERRRLVDEFLAGPGAGQFDNPVQWFYDPMAAPAFAEGMGEILTVYDCMDELSKFRGAPPGIVERERHLLARSEVVFTGGRKLFEAKSRLHTNCHFYGCGVDSAHFGRARSKATAVPTEIAGLAGPVLGYFGVVDERLDYELLATLADASPAWSIAVVGPVVKVDPASLPQRPNLQWLGQRPYADLPAFCKGFAVCLMPFALNEATEFINPTKALEYMAAGREIVSTPIHDVVRNFGEVVRIGHCHAEFVAHCREALRQPDGAAITRGLQMAGENSWEAIVARLEGHIETALRTKWKRPGHARRARAGALPAAIMT